MNDPIYLLEKKFGDWFFIVFFKGDGVYNKAVKISFVVKRKYTLTLRLDKEIDR